MGEITDLVLSGVLCQECGGLVAEPDNDGYGMGFPQTCPDCLEEK